MHIKQPSASPRLPQASAPPAPEEVTPVPRWDLINLRHYVTMTAQFSRGSPFDCEFCDIIVMSGRVPRPKSPAQLVDELEALSQRGWKDMVFLVDENFIGNKRRTKELLHPLIEWRRKSKAKMVFFDRSLRQPR